MATAVIGFYPDLFGLSGDGASAGEIRTVMNDHGFQPVHIVLQLIRRGPPTG